MTPQFGRDVTRLALLALGLAACSAPTASSVQTPPAAPAPATPPAEALLVETGPDAERSAAVEHEDEPEVEDGPGWLGVELSAQPPAEAGVLIRDVTRDSPAERAGLLAGDVILSLDGEPVSRPADVVRAVSLRRAGSRLAVVFKRGTASRLVAAVLGARPDTEGLLRKDYIGVLAPNFGPLTAVQGSIPERLSALRGKVVVIEFWASWCVPCRMTAPKLNSWHDRWAAQGLEVLGVTTDPATFATQAALEFGIEYPVASDESGQTSRVFKALSIPTLFVIDREGVVREVVVGYSTERLKQAERLVEQLVAAR